MEYGLIGMPLGHSFSKEIHEELGFYSYELHEVTAEDFGAFMRARNFKAINVTIPYKQDVIPYLDEIDPLAAEIGAVNCIVNRNGKLHGYNTDLAGMQALAAKLGLALEGKKVLICGTGGTSKTARTMAKAAGAKTVLRLSRIAKSGASYADVITYAQAYNDHADAQIIINTTPSGMYPNNETFPLNAAAFYQLEGILDAVYNPLETALVQQGHAMGIPAEGGLYMLVAQAIVAAQHFTGKKLNVAAKTAGIFHKLERQKRNLVLIGMPGCGKTTVGNLLAQSTGRPLVDTDLLICDMTGKTPDEIIAEEGEEVFRAIETQAVAAAAKESGRIIATGGGAILRDENVGALQQNGRLYFIDRPVADLVPTSDRPLSDSEAKIAQLYQQRYPRYVACADEIITVNGNAQTVAKLIEKRHFA